MALVSDHSRRVTSIQDLREVVGFFMDSRWDKLVVVVVFIWYQRAIVDPAWGRVLDLVVEVA